MRYHACPLVAALAVVAVGWNAVGHDRPQPAAAFGYRVTGAYPVVVLAQPAWGALVVGTVAPGSVVAGFDDGVAPPQADFRHVVEPDGDGWVPSADLTPEWLNGRNTETGFEPTFHAPCADRPADCVGP